MSLWRFYLVGFPCPVEMIYTTPFTQIIYRNIYDHIYDKKVKEWKILKQPIYV
jgi:hypothetical protein